MTARPTVSQCQKIAFCSNDNNSQNQEGNTMGDIDNPNNMIIIPPLPGRQLRLRKRKKRRLIKTSLSQQWPLLFASLLQYVFDYNVTNELFLSPFPSSHSYGKTCFDFFFRCLPSLDQRYFKHQRSTIQGIDLS